MKRAWKKVCGLVLALLLGVGATLPAGALTLDLEKTYTDVKRSDWFYNDVYWATITDTMSGTGTAFEPNAPMTRAMLVTTLYNRASPTELDYKGSRFQDVAKDQWYTAPIEWAASWGIVSGTGTGDFTFDTPTLETFSPTAPVTRQDAAVILYQYAQLLGGDTETTGYPLNRFPDGWDTSLYARNAMEWAVAQRVFNGSDGKLLPKEPLTRAQAAAVLHHFAIELYSQDIDETALGEAPVHPVPDAGYLRGDTIYRYRIPEVELSGVDVAEVNEEIQETYGQLYEDAIGNIEQGYAPVVDEIGYFWNVKKRGDKILSLVTWERSNMTDYRFTVWNINTATGETLDSAALLENAGNTLNEYEEAAKEALKTAFDQWARIWKTADPDRLQQIDLCRYRTLYPANYGLEEWDTPENDNFFADVELRLPGAQLFQDSNGQLWMVGRVWTDVGSQQRYVCLPLGDPTRFWDR